MFSIQDRDRLCERVLELAKADTRVVAGAVVGSLARTAGDRWSDLDLTFGVSDGVPVGDVLEDWTGTLSIACVRLGLPADYGKGFDDLPADVRAAFDGSLVTSSDRAELLRALERVIEGLLVEARAFPGLATAVEGQLRSLTRASTFQTQGSRTAFAPGGAWRDSPKRRS